MIEFCSCMINLFRVYEITFFRERKNNTDFDMIDYLSIQQ